MEVLTIDAGGEIVLPLFSSQEEGEFYLAHQSASVASRLRETTTGELVSLLLGLCARVDTVALDPLPRLGEREEIVELVRTGRRQFVHHLLGEVTAHSEQEGSEVNGFPEKVLLATDGLENTALADRAAVDLAKKDDAKKSTSERRNNEAFAP
jgi:hypothetical protein